MIISISTDIEDIKLVPAFESKALGKSYACCDNHTLEALEHLKGLKVNVRKLTPPDHQCSCGKKATWFLIEQQAIITKGVRTP